MRYATSFIMSYINQDNSYLLFHVHNSTSRPMTWPHGDFWANMFDLLPIYIDTDDGSVPGITCPVVGFSSLAAAMADTELAQLTWIWLDHTAERYLDEYDHPASGVVYVLGDDYEGWGDNVPNGERVCVRGLGEVHASIIAPIVCCDRYTHVYGGIRSH